MKLNRVTITGADDQVAIADLKEMSRDFPFVEWGILVSKARVGSARYPSREWCASLARTCADWNLSMHVCGTWAKQVFAGTLNWQELPNVMDVAARYQINGNGDMAAQGVDYLSLVQFIFQHPASEKLIANLNHAGVPASPLFDKSGGRGEAPQEIARPLPGLYCGWAGGIGLDNVRQTIEAIQVFPGDAEFWIDMEDRVRDEHDRLDLYVAEEILKIASEYVR